jgi:VanZ family protein
MPDARRRTLALWAPVLAYMVFIFGLSSISHPPAMPGGSDKWLHSLLYSGLGALFSRALSGGWRRVALRHVALTICFGAIYGASDEFHQHFNPPRNVEVADVVADTIGAGAAAAALHAWGIIRGRDGL